MINLKTLAAQPPITQALLRLAPALVTEPAASPGPPLAAPLDWKQGKPRVLLLQGPAGPFFRRLQRRLHEGGFEASRVCFNAGDRLFAGDPDAIRFAGTLADWPSRFSGLLRQYRPDLVVLFGAERPVHATARSIARADGVPVLCLEEGYQRPGWITAELDGNNAASPLAGLIPPPDWDPKPGTGPDGAPGRGFRQACLYAAAYYGAQALLNRKSEQGLIHRTVRANDCAYFARNVVRKLAHALRDASTVAALERLHAGRYAVVALQVPGDSQLGAAAQGWTNERLVEASLAAFAAAGGRAVERLVFKIHPLDRGHTGLAPTIRERARGLGLGDRVEVLHCGSAGTVIRHSAGLVTINSTAGFSAIFHGVPLVALGRAVYGHPALAQSGGREAIEALFRGEARCPDPELRPRYLAWIRERSLLPGDFYSARGTAEACDNLAERVAELCLPGFARNHGTTT